MSVRVSLGSTTTEEEKNRCCWEARKKMMKNDLISCEFGLTAHLLARSSAESTSLSNHEKSWENIEKAPWYVSFVQVVVLHHVK